MSRSFEGTTASHFWSALRSRRTASTTADTTEPDARFAALWERERPRVWRVVARVTGSHDAADDLTQEVSLQALRGFAAFRGEAKASTWLYRLAVNVALRYREKQRESVPLESTHTNVLRVDVAGLPEAQLLASERIPRVRACLEALPDDLRTPLVLRVYEELSYREIADLLQIPIGTVMSRLHTARQRVKILLQKEGEDGLL